MTTLATPYKYSQGYITYQLPMLPGLPDQVQVAGRTYRIKDELHVSLVKVLPATDQIAERDHLTLEAAEEVTSAVCFAGISKVKPEFDHYLNDVRLVDGNRYGCAPKGGESENNYHDQKGKTPHSSPSKMRFALGRLTTPNIPERFRRRRRRSSQRCSARWPLFGRRISSATIWPISITPRFGTSVVKG